MHHLLEHINQDIKGDKAKIRTQQYIKLNTRAKEIPQAKIIIEYDQEIPQSQTADKPMAWRRRATLQSRDTRKTNEAKQPALSSPPR